jgi:nicotinate-nucleotide adenylyltransferase
MTNLGLHLEPGMKVGLYGGSFDPAHAGHRHVAETALRRLGLDRVVWLVSPGNPLKQDPAHGLAARMAGARRVARNPRMIVSDAEARLGTRYTVDTLRALRHRYPGVRFVWIMGADSLAGFHRWKGWAEILRRVPVAVVPRPGCGARARFARAPRRFAHARLPAHAGRSLPSARAPAWIDLPAPLNAQSSTALRAAALVAS